MAGDSRQDHGRGGRPPCRSVLVVEDDESIRTTLEFALRMEGYDVKGAENGRIGLDLLATIPKPCLILLDLMMPVMNGWEFVDALKRDVMLVTIPVVVVTAFYDEATTIEAEAVIKKPVDLDLLYETVRKWCVPVDGGHAPPAGSPPAAG